MNPGDGYITYIINPKSGASSGERMVGQFKDYLCDNGFDVRVTFSTSIAHVNELATKAAVDYQCRMVVVAGGDGTVRQAVQGLEGSDKPLLIIPCGTENLLANELGFDVRTKTIIKAFKGNCIKSLDMGNANGRYFTCLVGFGFDGDVIGRVNENRAGHINHLDYFWPIWRTFWEYKFAEFKVVIDDQQVFEGTGLLFVGNTSRYAVGIEILQHADFGDGLLDVCIYKCQSRISLVKYSLMTILKLHADRKGIIYRQGKKIQVSSTAPNIKTQIDGDPGPALPINIEIIPQAVKVLVPPDAKPAGIRTRLLRVVG